MKNKMKRFKKSTIDDILSKLGERYYNPNAYDITIREDLVNYINSGLNDILKCIRECYDNPRNRIIITIHEQPSKEIIIDNKKYMIIPLHD